MANYLSDYSGSQIDAVIKLFHDIGIGEITGIVTKDSQGRFAFMNLSTLLQITGGSQAQFTQGADSFSEANLHMDTDDNDTEALEISFSGGSFSQGTDSFTTNTPTSISVKTN